MNDRGDVIFLTIALTLIAGVPVALYTVYYFADSIRFVAAGVLLVTVLVAIAGILFARYKDHIFSNILKTPARLLEDLSEPLSEAVSEYASGNTEGGRERTEAFFRGALAHYSWIRTRQWIVAAGAGLLIGFAGLVGSALLKQQNDLILRQNEFFRQQIDQQQSQLELQQQVSNQTIRSEAIRRIYGAEFAGTPRVRAEAVRSLIAVERVRIAVDQNTLVTPFINLHEADLSSAWLENADLAKVSFRDTQLERANFNAANMADARFRYARLNAASFIGADLNNAIFSFSLAQNAQFSNAKLAEAAFMSVDLKGSDFSGARFEGASFTNANLENADLREIENWRAITSIEGANIFWRSQCAGRVCRLGDRQRRD